MTAPVVGSSRVRTPVCELGTHTEPKAISGFPGHGSSATVFFTASGPTGGGGGGGGETIVNATVVTRLFFFFLSTARTWSLCAPNDSAVVVKRAAHFFIGATSTAHSNDTAPFALKLKVGVMSAVERAPVTVGAGGAPAARPKTSDRRAASLIMIVPRVAGL